MPLSIEELIGIREDAFADDIEIPAEAAECWTRQQAVSFFESGGTSVPTKAAAPLQQLPPGSPVRFLCLHGGGGNRSVMKLQTARLVAALGHNHVELAFLEGSRESKLADVEPALIKMFGSGPYFGWYGVENDAVDAPSGSKQYIDALLDWSVEFRYTAVDEALDRADAYIEEHGPFDALLGFSQGGIVVTMLTQRRLDRAARGVGKPPSWRCNILMSSMSPRSGPCRAVPKPVKPPLHGFPAISIVGSKDHFYKNCHLLHNIYDNLQWFEHDGGHHAPSSKELNAEIACAIWRTLGFEQQTA
jgi:predicted esterase